MGAKRPAKIKKKAYVEIDLKALQETGEIKIVGEPILAPEVTTKVPKGRFEIVYCAELFDIMKELGNRKMNVLTYLLDHKDGNNCINATNTQLANTIGVSRPTVIDTIKALENAGLATRKNSVLMISPNLMVKGSQLREAFLMHKFEELSEEKRLPILEGEIEGQMEVNMDGDVIEHVK